VAVAYESDGGTVFAASANNNAITVTLPATRPVGSVLYFVGFCRLITATVGTAPSGYTLLNTFTSGTASGGRIWVYTKEVVGGESAPTFALTGPVTGNSGDLWGACLYCFSGVDLSGGISAIHDETPTTTDASGTTTCTYPASTGNTEVGNMIVRYLARIRDAADTFTPTASPLHDEREDASSTIRTGAQHHCQTRTTTATGSQASVTVAPSNTTAARYLAVTALLKAGPVVFDRSAAIAATADISSSGVKVGVHSRSVSLSATAGIATVGRVAPFGVSDNASALLDARFISGADGDPVTTWSDGSGLGNNATGGTPSLQTGELNGLPVVRFDGVDDKLSLAGITNNDATRTIFVVARAATTGVVQSLLSWVSTTARLGVATAGSVAWRLTETGTVANAGGNDFWTPGGVATVRFNGTGSADLYADDEAAVNFDPDDSYQSATNSLNVGSSTSGGAAFLTGDIAVVYVFDSALSDADVDAVRNGLISRWIPSAATHERSAAISATADIASAGTFWTTFERSAAIGATGSLATTATFFSVFSGQAVLSATGQIATAGAAVKSRSAALTAVGAIASDGFGILERSASLSATGAIATSATFWTTLERAAAISAGGDIAARGERVVSRAASLGAAGSIASSGEVEAGAVTHERSAALTATAGIASSATFFSILARSAAIDGQAGISTSPQRALQRSASLTAAPSLAATGLRVHARSAQITALGGIAAAGEISGIAQRSASLTATAGISTAHQRELQRRVLVAATATIATAHRRELLRFATMTATAGIASAGTVGAVVAAAAELIAAGNIVAAGRVLEDFERSAALSAVAMMIARGEVSSGRWPPAGDDRWPPDADEEWSGGSDEHWEEQTDDRWLVSAESRW
jgi:hypothetical protein